MKQSSHLVQPNTFTFDYIYDQSSSQENVYENTAKLAVLNCLEV